MTTNGQNGVMGAPGRPSPHSKAQVLVVGGGPVGCLTALKLGKAGIQVDILETLPTTSTAPRGVGHNGPVLFVFNELGVYDKILEHGFLTTEFAWVKEPVSDGKGGKRQGDTVVAMHLGPPQPKFGDGMVHCTQAKLNAVLLQEALATGFVRIHFSTEFGSIVSNNSDGVEVLGRDTTTGEEKLFLADYAVGCDGGHSNVRKALKLPFPGHTWPEKIIATDVLRMNDELPRHLTSFIMHDVNWTITTPLEWPVKGQKTLWRLSIAQDPEDTRTDEELLSDNHLMGLYKTKMIGPYDQSVSIEKRSVYRIHQRLAPTFRRQRVILAGDAAHLNNPIGALGLNTGLLDADAAAEALIMIVKEGHSDELLSAYSDQRRRVFQEYTDPTSKANKLRLQLPPETAVQDDWLFRILARGPTPNEIADLSRPIWHFWRTDMRELAKELDGK